jgi:MFS family permease
MIVQEKRGAAMASFAIGPLLGPIVGPVVGGIVTNALGWRWVFWIIAMIAGALSGLMFFFSRETFAPVILEQKTRKLQKETGNYLLRSKLASGLQPRDHFRRSILRPFKMLLFSPVCIICGCYVGLAYAYLYLMFTSLTPLFMRIYHFDTVHAGLTFLGLGVGSMVGVAYFSVASDRYIKKKAKEDSATLGVGNGEKPEMKPEYRLPPLKIGSILLPAGFFIYGWTAEYKVHWIAPIIGTAIIGVGNLIVFMVMVTSKSRFYAALTHHYRLYKCTSLTASQYTLHLLWRPMLLSDLLPGRSCHLPVCQCTMLWDLAGETACLVS